LDPGIDVTQVQPTADTLAIRPLDAARPYRQSLAYRDGSQLGQYVTVEWAELPSDVVTRALSDAIRETGRFSDIGFAPNVKQPDYVLTGTVRAFEVRQDTDPWTAICEVRIEVREALGRNSLYTETLTRSVPLESNEVSALPAAMSVAVGEIVSEAANGIAAP
jgi:ABC-type uncharacterized transport system auxiliary subunit